jgi:hypothetical protein
VSALGAEIIENAINLRWRGITCDTDVTRRVNSVNLSNSQLVGPFPTFLCRLPSLLNSLIALLVTIENLQNEVSNLRERSQSQRFK